MTGRRILLVSAALMALAACDRAADRTPQRAVVPTPAVDPSGLRGLASGVVAEAASPVAWDDKAQAFTFNGKPLRAEKLWTFEGASDGFVAAGGDVLPAKSSGLIVEETAADAILRTPRGLNIDGAVRSLVIVRLTRLRPAKLWDGTLYYSTPGHTETAEFFAKPVSGTNPAVNQTVTLIYDMHQLRAGGDDWKASIIDQVRLDLDDTPGGAFVLRQVAIAQDPGGVVPRKIEPAPAKAAAASDAPKKAASKK